MFKKILGGFSPFKNFKKRITDINAFEKELEQLTDEELKQRSRQLKGGDDLDEILPEAFALVREAAKRTLDQRHFDVQLMGGIALHQGKIVEMMTGEGKTLASTAPAYLNALASKGVHVITVNDYLAERDAVWMGQIYDFLGLTVSCLTHEGAFLYDSKYEGSDGERDEERDALGSFRVEKSYLRPISRKEAYQADITYGTNHEFGFDYLRDNLASVREGQVQRGFNYAIIDEIDSILIDEARTPLIISAPDAESSDYYKVFSKIVSRLQKDVDYIVEEKHKVVTITPEGIDKVEKQLGKNLFDADNLRLNHYLQETLKAYGLFRKDKDYVVKDGQIIIVDQFTGRLMHGRRYSAGLHQALEAKESVAVQNESRTYAQITIQNYFRLYKKLAGMTGTAQTSAEEFDKVYGLDVVTVPTNKPVVRNDLTDLIYKNSEAKYKAIVEDVKQRQAAGQPVLIGTVSIENNEDISRRLSLAGIKHEVLNAKNHEREGQIIAQAGQPGAVTVATNMAGRGVDIVLGGNPPDAVAGEKVKAAGGLHVIGTERHEARRIDNQLRGRSGRQGDSGSSQFFLSLDDDVLRIFGGERIKKVMESMNVPEDMPISAKLVNKAVEQAQSKVEGIHFDARKHLLDFDDVLNKQRLAVYRKRQDLMEKMVNPQALGVLDLFWMNHLEGIEALMDAVRIRAYGQHDPLVEFRREAHILYQEMMANFEKWLEENKDKISPRESSSVIASPEYPSVIASPDGSPRYNRDGVKDKAISSSLRATEESVAISKKTQELHEHPATNSPQGNIVSSDFSDKKVGRNDPCPCESGKKYKRCHGA